MTIFLKLTYRFSGILIKISTQNLTNRCKTYFRRMNATLKKNEDELALPDIKI